MGKNSNNSDAPYEEVDAITTRLVAQAQEDADKRGVTLDEWFEWALAQFEPESEDYQAIMEVKVLRAFQVTIAKLESKE